ncbi:MAG: sulfite exporter TauE/SafE family protein [Cyanobacteria bacterium P01_A01_bin.3]
MQSVLILAHLDLAPQLTSLLESPPNFSSAIAGLAIACTLGAAHALSPGHGKTLVSAYLIGTKGTPQQAILLGLTTSISHTLAIYTLGLIALFASQYLLPEQLYPYLSVASGLAICIVGIRLLFNRLHPPQPDRSLHHSHTHHTCSSCHDAADHSPADWSSLIALGISSGLTPCPSALVLLLSAVAIHRIPFGLVLVGGFSFGLAFVLTGLGLLAVYASQWLDRFPGTSRWVKQLPLVSAMFTICIGVGFLTYSVYGMVS